MKYTSLNTIRTVAAREISVALRSKAIIISYVIILILMIAGIGVATYLSNKEDTPPQLGLSGIERVEFVEFAPSSDLELTTLGSRDNAIQAVKDEEVDAALVSTNEKTDVKLELITDGSPDAQLLSIVEATADTLAHNATLGSLGISPQEFANAEISGGLTTTNISEDSDQEENIPGLLTALGATVLMVYFIILFAANIGGRITEEKSSRVVEIVLASVRPLDFLAGKLVGNTIIGVAATAIILAVGAIGLEISGLLDGFEFNYGILLLMLLAFVIGLLFFGALYAAAGSMVQRAEDLQSTQMPVMILIFGLIYAPSFGWMALDSTIMRILAWVPPFGLSVAPMQLEAGNMSLIAVLGSFGLCIIATVGVMLVVAKIYRNAILNNGKKMTWISALK